MILTSKNMILMCFCSVICVTYTDVRDCFTVPFFRDRRYEFVVCNFEWRQDEEELVIG